MLHSPLKSAVPDDHTHKEGPVGVVTDDSTHKEGPVGVVPDDHTQKECPAAEPADARSEGFTSEPVHTAGRQSSEDDQSEKPMQPVGKVVVRAEQCIHVTNYYCDLHHGAGCVPEQCGKHQKT